MREQFDPWDIDETLSIDDEKFLKYEKEVPMKKAMNWKGVTSSAIAAVDYHKEERVLFVLFKAGSIHAYHDVSEYKFKQLLDAPSVGAYFNASIKKQHPETKEL